MSAHQLHRELKVTYKSAWFLCHRIRDTMRDPKFRRMLSGTVEVDETYVGGKPRFKGQRKRGRGTSKPIVVALVERGGNIRTKRTKTVSANDLKHIIRNTVKNTARICTDELKSYNGLEKEFKGGHGRVNHASGQYANGTDHVNSAEGFFALLKRGVHGTFHHVSERHLKRYAHKFSFRWNTRKANDDEKTLATLNSVTGKRLMYREPKKGTVDTLTS